MVTDVSNEPVTSVFMVGETPHYLSITTTNQFMLLRQIIVAYCENLAEHTDNTVWAVKAALRELKP